MNTAVLGLSPADPSIPWAPRGSAETALCERDGWERRQIRTVDCGKPTTMPAMVRESLAVNRMLHGDEGFAICLSATGCRISYGGSVFARCAAAMAAAEAMLSSCSDWDSVQTRGYTDAQRRALQTIIEAAEQRGEILLDKVFPT